MTVTCFPDFEMMLFQTFLKDSDAPILFWSRTFTATPSQIQLQWHSIDHQIRIGDSVTLF